MKSNDNSINKMIKSFDKELRNLLLTDLEVARVASKALVKTITSIDNNLNNEQLLIA